MPGRWTHCLWLLGVLAWGGSDALGNRARAQVPDPDASQSDALQPFVMPRFPDLRNAAAGPADPQEFPAPRPAPPGAAAGAPLEVIEFRDVPLQEAMRLLSQ